MQLYLKKVGGRERHIWKDRDKKRYGETKKPWKIRERERELKINLREKLPMLKYIACIGTIFENEKHLLF